jgi:hypothetical protein
MLFRPMRIRRHSFLFFLHKKMVRRIPRLTAFSSAHNPSPAVGAGSGARLPCQTQELAENFPQRIEMTITEAQP